MSLLASFALPSLAPCLSFFRIDFKILLLIHKVLNGLAPPYLYQLLHLHTPARTLRWTKQLLLDVPRSSHKNSGDWAFLVIAPSLWNSLPSNKRAAQKSKTFKSLLKTHLFSLAFTPSWVDTPRLHLLSCNSLLLFYYFVYCFYLFCFCIICLTSSLVNFSCLKCVM